MMALCHDDQSLTRCLACLKKMAHKTPFHAYSTILDSFFYAYTPNVDGLVIVSFFEIHYTPQYYR